MSAPARAVEVLRALVAGGVREVVLAPGSRSAPFALALYAADAAGDLRLHVRLDERTAGFLALGLSVGSRRPVAVVTTSGTAVGNLLPAVMEAHHAGRSLIVVSADRPAVLRGTGANQTTWQDGIFGRFAPCVDLSPEATETQVLQAVRAAVDGAGPAHLNVQFDAPLVPGPSQPWWPGPGGARPAGARPADRPVEPADGPEALELPAGPRTVLVAGDDAGHAARVLAETAGWPLLAEPTSGSRAGRHPIRTHRLLLGAGSGAGRELTAQIERVVVVGHPTLSRPVSALLARPDVQLLAVAGRAGVATDPARRASRLAVLPRPAAPGAGEHAWLARWLAADAQLSGRVDRFLAQLPELDALHVAAEVGAAFGPGETLVVAASNPVRDLDLALAPYPPRERRLVVANRGLSGIDGTLSTAIGVALGRPDAPRTRALVGDLAFLHDASALFLGPDEPRPDLTIVVANDDGGSIFALLEQGAPDYAPAFERVFATPHGTDLAALAAASHTAYTRVQSRAQLRAALAEPGRGLRVVEAQVSRADRRATAAAIAALAEDLPAPGGMP